MICPLTSSVSTAGYSRVSKSINSIFFTSRYRLSVCQCPFPWPNHYPYFSTSSLTPTMSASQLGKPPWDGQHSLHLTWTESRLRRSVSGHVGTACRSGGVYHGERLKTRENLERSSAVFGIRGCGGGVDGGDRGGTLVVHELVCKFRSVTWLHYMDQGFGWQFRRRVD